MKWIGQQIYDQIVRFRNDVYFESDTITFTSASADDPAVIIENTTADDQAARLQFKKHRGVDAVDGDNIGEIEFWGYDDGTPSTQLYGKITTEIHDATSNEESGQMLLSVASHDGGSNTGLKLTGGSLDNEVDVEVGRGLASVTTIMGALSVTNSLILDSVGITTIQTSAESFVDNDTSFMTSAAIDDRINTAVTAEDLDVAGDSGTAAVDLNSQSLTVAGGTGITTVASGQTATINVDAAQTGITSVGTLSSLAVTSAVDLGSAAMTLTNADIDQVALDISAENTTANIIDINATATTSGNAIFIDSTNARNEFYIDRDCTATGDQSHTGMIQLDGRKASITGAGDTHEMIGLRSSITDTATNVGTSNLTNLELGSNMTNAGGTTSLIGISNTLTGASDTLVGYLSNVVNGSSDMKFVSSADATDYFTIATGAVGATTLTTVDTTVGATAHFEIAADGDITLDSAGQIKLEPIAGNNILLDGVLTVDAGQVKPLATAHNAAGTVVSIGSGATTAGTTNNIAGGALTIHGGQGKGSGRGGDIIFKTASPGSSGSTLNSLATALTISDDLSATFAGTIVGDVTGDLTGRADTVATIAGLAPNTATTQATQPNIESIGTDGDTLDILGDHLTMSNTTSSKPAITLTNLTDDTSGPIVTLINQRVDSSTQAGEDGDYLGTIKFTGYDDQGTPGANAYAQIYSTIHDATSGEESGHLNFSVANHDGGQGLGLRLTGGSVNDEVDVLIGLGAASTTTIAGSLRPTGQLHLQQTSFTDDIGTTEHYVPFNSTAESPTATNINIPMIMPVAGKLLKVHYRTNLDHSGQTTTWKLKQITGSESWTTGNTGTLGTQSGTGPTPAEVATVDFQSSLDSGTNAFSAGDMISLSVTNASGLGASKYVITAVFELDFSSY